MTGRRRGEPAETEQSIVVLEDSPLKFAQTWSRLECHLSRQLAPVAPIGGQGIHLAAAAVESQDLESAGLLIEGVDEDQRLQLGQGQALLPKGDGSMQVIDLRAQAEGVKPGRFRGGKGLIAEPLERRPAP